MAQDEPRADSEPVTLPASAWRWVYIVRNRTGYRLERPRVFQMSRTLADVKGVGRLSEGWRLTMEGRAHYDPVGRLGYPRVLWFDPRQFLLDGRAGPLSLSLGLQQVVWGQADGLRILDIINPLDYREFILEDFLDARRPLWTARVDMPIEKGSLQFIWIPYFASGRLPASGNEFGLGASYGLGLFSAAVDRRFPSLSIQRGPVHVAVTQRPAYQLKSSQAGTRYSRSLGRWDVTANFLYGWEDIATTYLQASPEGQPAIVPGLTIAPRFDRKAVFGGTATTNFGSVVLRMEAGWSARRAAAITSFTSGSGFKKFGQFSGIVGADYSVHPWLWVSSQYFLQFTSAPSHALLLPRNRHFVSFYVRGDLWRDSLKPEVFILAGLNEQAYLIRPRIVRHFSNHWSMAAGADFLGGRRINPFGSFATRDRFVLEIKWMK